MSYVISISNNKNTNSLQEINVFLGEEEFLCDAYICIICNAMGSVFQCSVWKMQRCASWRYLFLIKASGRIRICILSPVGPPPRDRWVIWTPANNGREYLGSPFRSASTGLKLQEVLYQYLNFLVSRLLYALQHFSGRPHNFCSCGLYRPTLSALEIKKPRPSEGLKILGLRFENPCFLPYRSVPRACRVCRVGYI